MNGIALLRWAIPDARPLSERWPEWAARQDAVVLRLLAAVRSEAARTALRRLRTRQALALAVRAEELGFDPARWLAVWEEGGAPEPPATGRAWLALRKWLDDWERECLDAGSGGEVNGVVQRSAPGPGSNPAAPA